MGARPIALFTLLLTILGPPLGAGIPQADPSREGPRFLLAQFGGQRPGTEEEKEKARVRIGMTKEQQAQIEALYAGTDQQMRDIGGRMRDLYRQLRTLYDSYDFDRRQAGDIRKEIADLHRKILHLHYDNEEKLRRILNREQFQRLRELMKEEWRNHRRDFDRGRGRPGAPGT